MTVLINLSYLREHDAAADLPRLSLRRPLHSGKLLLGSRAWLRGFAMESGGFMLYCSAPSLLQIGYQSGAALTVARLATLFTNAVPIAAGTVVLGEDLPGGTLGVMRVLAFAAVTAGAILLARPEPSRHASDHKDRPSGRLPVPTPTAGAREPGLHDRRPVAPH